MPRLYVIFDSNVYRQLSTSAFAELQRLERDQSVVGLASYWVAAEFISHLASLDDPDFWRSWGSLKRLHQHCTQFNGMEELRFIADSDDHLCDILFNRTPAKTDIAPLLGQLVGFIVSATSREDLQQVQENIETIRDYVKAEEARFAQEMMERVILPVVPQAQSWNAIRQNRQLRAAVIDNLNGANGFRLLAQSLVRRAAWLLGIELDEPTLSVKIDVVLQTFALPIRLYDQIVRHIIEDGYDLTRPKNANSLWDWHISFSTSKVAHVDGSPLWLISDDKALTSAASDCEATHVVRKLADYCAILGGSSDEFIAVVEARDRVPHRL